MRAKSIRDGSKPMFNKPPRYTFIMLLYVLLMARASDIATKNPRMSVEYFVIGELRNLFM
jgi:hypothetical protein